MLLPERMCRMDCLIDRQHRDDLAAALHSEGIVQVEFLDDSHLEKNSVSRDVPSERVSTVSELIVKARRVLDGLEEYSQSQPGFIEDLLAVHNAPPLMVEEKSFEELIDYSKSIITPAEEKLNELNSKLNELNSRENDLKALIDKYSLYTGLGLKSEHFNESDYLLKLIGIIPSDQISNLESNLFEKLKNNFILTQAKDLKGDSIVALITLKKDCELVEELLRKSRFTKLVFDISGKLDELVTKASKDYGDISGKRTKLVESYIKLSIQYSESLNSTVELLEIEKDRCEVFLNCGSTSSVTYIRLWTPKRDAGKVESIIKEHTHSRYAIQKKTDLTDAPVLLNNPWWLRPFESLTNMFSPPRYNEIDPTVLIAPAFVLFFGFMMADFFYGLGFILLALLLNKKYGKYSPSIKDVSFILTAFGLTAMVFGVLTGNYFGDFLGTYILGTSSQDIALFNDPLNGANAILFLVIALVVGVLQVYLGYFFGFFDKLQRGDVKGAVTSQLSWFAIAAGIVVLALTYYPAEAPFLASSYWMIAALLFSSGVALLVLGAGPMALMDIPGLLGRVMSYSRLLALGLTTSGMALALNMLVSLAFQIPKVGIIIAFFVFTFGHIGILFLNAIGSFVHSLRLQFVEFFGTFYTGGGLEFTPFREIRKYTKRGVN